MTEIPQNLNPKTLSLLLTPGREKKENLILKILNCLILGKAIFLQKNPKELKKLED